MTPIDQIRKALEALTTAEAGGMWGDIEYAREGFWNVVDRASVEALLASRDAAVQRAAELEARIPAWELKHAAAIEATARTAAREMQERCARVADGFIPDPNQPIAQSDYDRGWIRGATRIAAAIRAIKE